MDIRPEPVKYHTWGEENIDPSARDQMKHAAHLPVSVRGALMPDAHVGYGLPIGGVLATRNAIIPYAVGVDIACRMKMTIFDVSPHMLNKKREKLKKVIERETLFGVGKGFDIREQHPVLDDEAWNVDPFIKKLKDTAWEQLGTSGSGNHFAEFGILDVQATIEGDESTTGEGSRTYGTVPEGTYLAFLTHSGSRGFGAQVASHFKTIAMDLRSDLPKEYLHLAWLDMDSEEGQLYWQAMNLAGRYASANHAVIHRKVIDALRLEVIGGVENHHNFAWKEEHDGEDVYVHRKGATPAGSGVYGVIPGSMLAPGYVVCGKGNETSLNSAAHGAGRRMSRSAAKKRFEWDEVNEILRNADIDLLSADLDESPGAYKNIRDVMDAQQDLVDVVAEFTPRIVKMAPGRKSRQRDNRKREKEKTKRKRKRRR